MHILLQGIASGLSGRRVGRTPAADEPPVRGSDKKQIEPARPTGPKHVESAEELMGILMGSGIPGGVISRG